MHRILLTGSRGFVGRALRPLLLQAGYDVVEHDQEEGDLSRQMPAAEGIEHVLHLAGRTFVPESWENPPLHYQINLLGTVNVLEFCRRNGCGITLVSSYVYGQPRYLPVDENHPLDPAAPYNHSKYLAEEAARFYQARFAVPLTILRPFNIYGPGQRGEFLIPSLIRQTLDPNCQTIEVADDSPRRDFLYLADFCQAILATLSHPLGGIYNIASGRSFSVAEIASLVQKAAGTAKPLRSRGEKRQGEVQDLYADISRARSQLGWSPQVPLAEGLHRCVMTTSTASEGK